MVNLSPFASNYSAIYLKYDLCKERNGSNLQEMMGCLLKYVRNLLLV